MVGPWRRKLRGQGGKGLAPPGWVAGMGMGVFLLGQNPFADRTTHMIAVLNGGDAQLSS